MHLWGTQACNFEGKREKTVDLFSPGNFLYIISNLRIEPGPYVLLYF